MKSWAQLSPSHTSRFAGATPTLSLFNTSTQAVQSLPKKDKYRLYVCGITPYDATHLGHAATYLTFDLINRYLRFSGAEVVFVENITDIDDPLLERADRDGIDWQDLAHSQIELFRGDMVALHIIPPDAYIGVIEAMEIIIQSIQRLKDKGALYDVDGDLYFEVRRDPEFLHRSHLSLETAMQYFSERGGDPNREGKRVLSMHWCGSLNDQVNQGGLVHLALVGLDGTLNVRQSPFIFCNRKRPMTLQ
jgi:L-cysteine:1D-myo-inositol 2-amino-2-deoxy-alpha-D-glucopyranoside ligase